MTLLIPWLLSKNLLKVVFNFGIYKPMFIISNKYNTHLTSTGLWQVINYLLWQCSPNSHRIFWHAKTDKWIFRSLLSRSWKIQPWQTLKDHCCFIGLNLKLYINIWWHLKIRGEQILSMSECKTSCNLKCVTTLSK